MIQLFLQTEATIRHCAWKNVYKPSTEFIPLKYRRNMFNHLFWQFIYLFQHLDTIKIFLTKTCILFLKMICAVYIFQAILRSVNNSFICHLKIAKITGNKSNMQYIFIALQDSFTKSISNWIIGWFFFFGIQYSIRCYLYHMCMKSIITKFFKKTIIQYGIIYEDYISSPGTQCTFSERFCSHHSCSVLQFLHRSFTSKETFSKCSILASLKLGY